MQPTVPAWVSWYRRLRPAERALDRPATRARAPARVAVYTSVYNPRDDTNLHLIRLDDMLGKQHLIPTPSNEWLKRLNINADMWHAHVSPELSRQALEYQHRFHNYQPVSIMVPPSKNNASPSEGIETSHSTGAMWGGWAAGAILLALLVLFVRAAEKCLDRRLFKNSGRRQSEEWPTPNVMATSLQLQNIDAGALSHLDDSEFASPGQRNSDLPPPYSECAPKTNTDNKIYDDISNEEPPPPYSACLVAFSNKDIPTVHILRRHTIDEPHTSAEADIVHNDLIENSHRVDHERNYDEGTVRVELVFDNGRIVERTIDIESTDNVPEIVVDVGETVIGNNIDDNIATIDDNINDINSQARVVLV